MENYFQFKVNSEYLWRDFEVDLGTFNYRSFYEEFDNTDPSDENFRFSEAYGVEGEVTEQAERLIRSLTEILSEWIESVNIPEKAKVRDSLVRLDSDAKFINFNYTHTLEILYGIAETQILYIHNKASEYRDLIFGHSLEEEAEPKGPEFDDNGEPTRHLFTDAEDAARAPFYNLKKNTGAGINEHRAFFKGLKGIKKIYVLGHSLGLVDWPYFRLVREHAPGADWYFSYYEEGEMESKRARAAKMLNVAMVDVMMVSLASLR